MLRGRLGLETARVPHTDRHGLQWLSRGALTVRDGTLRFERQSGPDPGSPSTPESMAYPSSPSRWSFWDRAPRSATTRCG